MRKGTSPRYQLTQAKPTTPTNTTNTTTTTTTTSSTPSTPTNKRPTRTSNIPKPSLSRYSPLPPSSSASSSSLPPSPSSTRSTPLPSLHSPKHSYLVRGGRGGVPRGPTMGPPASRRFSNNSPSLPPHPSLSSRMVRQRSGSDSQVAAAVAAADSHNTGACVVMRARAGKSGLERFPPHIVSMYRQIFHQIDVNNNGKISLNELSKALSVLSRDRLERMMQRGDVNKDGELDFEEFVGVMTNPDTDLGDSPDIANVPPELIREYRKIYDDIAKTQGSVGGGVRVEHLAAGLGISTEKSKQLFMQGDVNHDGVLSFAEFVHLMTNDSTDLSPSDSTTPPPPPTTSSTTSTSTISTMTTSTTAVPPPPPPPRTSTESISPSPSPSPSPQQNLRTSLDFGDFELNNNNNNSDNDELNTRRDSITSDSGGTTDRTAPALRRPSILSRQRPFSFDHVGDLLERSSQWAKDVEVAVKSKRKAAQDAKLRTSLTREMADQLEEEAVMMSIPQALIPEFKEIFNDIDIDHNGFVSATELARAFGIAVESAKELVSRVKSHKTQEPDCLTFPEFVDLVNDDKTYKTAEEEIAFAQSRARPRSGEEGGGVPVIGVLPPEPTPRSKEEIDAKIFQIKRMSLHLSHSLAQLQVPPRKKHP